MTSDELYLAAKGDDEQLAAFASVVADRADGIELFVDYSDAAITFTDGFVRYADALDLPIHTVHAPPIGLGEPGMDGQWDVELNTHVAEILLEYVKLDSPQQSDQASQSDETELVRRQKMKPSVFTAHLPRFPVEQNVDLKAARSKTIETIADSIEYITSDGFAGDDWEPPIVAVENVCQRPRFDHLLTSPEEVGWLRDRYRAINPAFDLEFTCDVGHTSRPLAML